MRVREKYASRYLKAEHLQGRTVRVQISHVEEDVPMGAEKEPKDVLHFKGSWRPLPLNQTNAKTLALLLGDDSDGWGDAYIYLYPVEMTAGPGVRIQACQADTNTEAMAPKTKKAAKPTTKVERDEANPPPHSGEDLIDGDALIDDLDFLFAK